MSSDSNWSREEQNKLEQALFQCAAICDPPKKWQAVANYVGSRTALECNEYFRHHQSTQRQDASLEEDADNAGDVESQGEGCGDEDTTPIPAQYAGRSSKKTWNNRWTGNWWWNSWSHTEDSKPEQNDANSDRWWERGATSWNEGSQWESKDTWDDANPEKAKEDELAGLDECQRRALEMRREVEANRERLRRREEREAEERKRKEAKQKEEEEKRAKERQEYAEEQERKVKAHLEEQRRREQQKQEKERQEQKKSECANSTFAPVQVVGKRILPKHGSWAGKTAAKQKGELQKQRKQEELERRAAEALANIAMSKGKKSKSDEIAEEEDEEEEEEQEEEPQSGSTFVGPSRQCLEPTKTEHLSVPASTAASGQGSSSSSSKVVSSASVNIQSGRSRKKQWWSKIDGDCPISLAPIAELMQPPFALEAEGSVHKHYYDARFLASFLLSSCDFIDPINRRELTFEECAALDQHLERYHREERCESSVADAFQLFERHGRDADSGVHAVQREATAVLQHLFRFRSARRTDNTGRAIAYEDGGLRIVDDDDILTSDPTVQPAPPVDLDRSTSADFPHLAPSDAGPAATPSKGVGKAWNARGKAGLGRPPGGEAYPSLPSAPAKAKAWGPPKAGSQAKAGGRGGGGKGRGGRK